MWLTLNNAFLSLVAHRTQPDSLMVRARGAGDIAAVFPQAVVTHTPTADYPYRAVILRSEMAAVIAGQIMADRLYQLQE